MKPIWFNADQYGLTELQALYSCHPSPILVPERNRRSDRAYKAQRLDDWQAYRQPEVEALKERWKEYFHALCIQLFEYLGSGEESLPGVTPILLQFVLDDFKLACSKDGEDI